MQWALGMKWLWGQMLFNKPVLGVGSRCSHCCLSVNGVPMIFNELLLRSFHYQTGTEQGNQATGLALKFSYDFSCDFMILVYFSDDFKIFDVISDELVRDITIQTHKISFPKSVLISQQDDVKSLWNQFWYHNKMTLGLYQISFWNHDILILWYHKFMKLKGTCEIIKVWYQMFMLS